MNSTLQLQLVKLWVILLGVFLAAAVAETDPRDVAALKALLRALKDPKGNLESWSSGDPCDSFWEGIICESLEKHRSVTELHLMKYELSGTIAPELGTMSNLRILNLMWNSISGSIPASLGNATNLELLLLNGNQLTGNIPVEIGNLANMNRFQIDENFITGPIPSTFGRLNSIKHLHMNNNSLTGGIPPELGKLPILLHILVDNNQLTGSLPVELANISTLQILQADNNQLNGSIPSEYKNIQLLLKMSLRNCSLQGTIPDISQLKILEFLDLSHNNLTGNIPSELPPNVTTMNVAHNQLEGNISASLAHHDKIQALLLSNNKLGGLVPIDFTQIQNPSHNVILDFQNNALQGFSAAFNGVKASNTILKLYGNPNICGSTNTLSDICTPQNFDQQAADEIQDVINQCDPGTCDPNANELMPALATEGKCRCVSRIIILCRLKSPGFTFFASYRQLFSDYLARDLKLLPRQVYVASSNWEPGPRLFINLKIFPPVLNDRDRRQLNQSEVKMIFEKFASWKIQDNPLFGPRELIAFYPPAGIDIFGGEEDHSSGLSKGALAGILIGVIAGTAILVALVVFKLSRRPGKSTSTRSLHAVTSSIKIDNVRAFTFDEMSAATDSFSSAREIGKGGYGRVYKGLLEDKQAVAIKRADPESHQGEHEFFTEIELLSRIHHRNLVSLIGFCVDQDDQMLVYEFIGGGTVSSRLTTKPPLNFKRRVYIALGAARGILYLHTEAQPPIIHRDIKGTNILIGDRDNAKVADFGLSKLAPEELADGQSGHVSTVVKGTPGYLDPEYFLTRKLSDKSDIYSFGVVLLELVTGMQAIQHGKNLVREVRAAYEEGVALTIVDPMMGAYPSEAMEPFVRLALSCCQDTPEGRPSIRVVVRDLEDIWKNMSSWIEEYDPEAKTPTRVSSTFDIASGGESSSRVLDNFSVTNMGPVLPR